MKTHKYKQFTIRSAETPDEHAMNGSGTYRHTIFDEAERPVTCARSIREAKNSINNVLWARENIPY